MRRFAYYPGCIAEFSSKELDATTKHLAPMLDIELLPMPAATCCGAGDIARQGIAELEALHRGALR